LSESQATDIEHYRSDMEYELITARIMQLELLPTDEHLQRLQRKFGTNITSWFEPSGQISGDIWDAWQVSPTKLAVCLVDFSTHGITAAMNTIRFFMLVRHRNKLMRDPAKYVQFLNKELCRVLLPQQFATIIYGIVDITAHTFTYAAAGSTQPLTVQLGTTNVIAGERSGLPLGISDKTSYENRSLSFSPGSALFLYSDAMTETQQADGTFIEDDGVMDILKAASESTGESLDVSKILEGFFNLAVRPLKDDLTAVCLVYPKNGEAK
jgi:phosphoserine phosphatase RsbU/P